MPQRCALGCKYDSSIPRHQFPHPERNPERFKAWVSLVGGKLENAADYAFYRKRVVCDIHFTQRDKNRNNRVNFEAVPTLHLPGSLIDDSMVEVHPMRPASEPLPTSGSTVTVLAEIPNAEIVTVPADLEPVSNQPCTSKQIPGGSLIDDSMVEVHPMPTASELLPTSVSTRTVLDEISNAEIVAVPADLEPVLKPPSTSKEIPGGKLNDVLLTGIPASPTPWKIPTMEHNYCKNYKKFTKGVKNAGNRKLVSSLFLEKLQLSRRRVKDLQSEIKRLRRRNEDFKGRLAKADKMSMSMLLKKITKNMTAAARIFTEMQFSETIKKPSGRRFSMEQKVLSLSMYKRSPKTYTFLAKNYTLPSAKSLKRLLAKVKVEPGLNQAIFLKMKRTVRNLSSEDRLCSLIFDEMSISPQVHYDNGKDELKGFTSDGEKFADHALVFMVKGLKKKFKQPVAYYFTNSMKTNELKKLIKEVIKQVNSTGLKVICTVCDQSTINVSAINSIISDAKTMYFQKGKEWKHDLMIVGTSKIIPLFDVPHLLKGVRNNLLTKDLKYFDFEAKKEKTIKWEYFKKIYEADKSYGELKLLQKLTDEHIYPEKIKKMKVKLAAQVFSHSVAVAAEHLTARGDLPEDCRNVINFIKMIDNLFDSLNCNSFCMPNGKIYKGCVRRNSVHHELWKNSIKVLKTVKFIKKVNNNNKIRFIETSAIPSIKNFIRTIEGIQQLWKVLSLKYSFDAMFTRNFNQDPLENFFGNIRSYGVRNTAPNTMSFEGAYKSLLLNNYNSPHSLHGNCESDENSCLQNLDFFLTEKDSVSDVPTDVEVLSIDNKESDEIVVPFINLNTEIKDLGQGNYVCGWVLGKCFKNVSKSCKNCKKDVLGDSQAKSNEYIRAKEYKKGGKSLLHPSEEVEKCFVAIQNIVTEFLRKDVPKKGLKKTIKMFTDIFVEFPFSCDSHKNELKEYFETTVINVLVYSWCRSVNRILTGKIIYSGNDVTKTAAQMYRNKHKHK